MMARFNGQWRSQNAEKVTHVKTSNDSLQLKSSSLGMENHFYHIRWTPLSVNIFYYARALIV